jgi:hypothetical protein
MIKLNNRPQVHDHRPANETPAPRPQPKSDPKPSVRDRRLDSSFEDKGFNPKVRERRSGKDVDPGFNPRVGDRRNEPGAVRMPTIRDRRGGEVSVGPVRMPSGPANTRDIDPGFRPRVRDQRGEPGPVRMPGFVRNGSLDHHLPHRHSGWDMPPPRMPGLPHYTPPRDLSARMATLELARQPGRVSGQQMAESILRGVSDLDGHSSTSELREFQKFAQQHPGKMTAEARDVLGIYQRYAQAAGPSGITQENLSKMATEMRGVKDSSAYRALEQLDRTQGPIGPEAMTRTVLAGIKDLDGQSTTSELTQFIDWAKENQSRLTDGAKAVLGLYFDAANQASARGQQGLGQNDLSMLAAQMRSIKTEPQSV